MRRTSSKEAAIRLVPKLARAAKRTAAETGKTVTQLANDGLELLLNRRKMAVELARSRRKGAMLDYEKVAADLRRNGLL